MDFGNVRDFLPRVLVNSLSKVAGFKELENPCSKCKGEIENHELAIQFIYCSVLV
jgi:hypothetical protein